MCRVNYLSLNKTYTFLTFVHNDADAANDYNRVIGIVQLKAFSCAKNRFIRSELLNNIYNSVEITKSG